MAAQIHLRDSSTGEAACASQARCQVELTFDRASVTCKACMRTREYREQLS